VTTVQETYNFCTLFDQNYASRGLALYRSLERVCEKDFTLTVLCMDEEVHEAFTRLALPRVQLWRVEDLGDAELLEVRKVRPRREFCWTCTGPLLLAMLREAPARGLATYLDADLAFFSDPAPIYEELGEKDILIHGHRFAPAYAAYAKPSGIFNVGLITVRNAPEGLQCLERWRAQNIEKCVMDPEHGFCGDQKYLEEWPSLYPGLVILQHPGGGVAPWNVDNYQFSKTGDAVLVDGQPLIFYHYHALRTIVAGHRRKWIAVASLNYRLKPVHLRLAYKPYVRMLRLAQRELDSVSLETPLFPVTFRQFLHLFRIRQLVTG
jgi:hypothetical protein